MTQKDLISLKGFYGGCLFRDDINYRLIERSTNKKHIGIKVKDDKDLNFDSLINDEYIKYYPIDDLTVIRIGDKKTIVKGYHNEITTGAGFCTDILNTGLTTEYGIFDEDMPLKEVLKNNNIYLDDKKTLVIEPSDIGIGKKYIGNQIQVNTSEDFEVYMRGFHKGSIFRDNGFYSKLAKEEGKFYVGIKVIDDEDFDVINLGDTEYIKYLPVEDLTIIDTEFERALIENYTGDIIVGPGNYDVINEGKDESVVKEQVVVEKAERLKDYLIKNKEKFEDEIDFNDVNNYKLIIIEPEQLGIIKDNKGIYRFNKEKEEKINPCCLRKVLVDENGKRISLNELLNKLKILIQRYERAKENGIEVFGLAEQIADIQVLIDEYYPEYKNEKNKQYHI